MTELDDLSARVHVRELLDRYHAGINTRDFDLLGTLFADDAIWEVGPEPAIHVRGRDAIVGKLHETVGRQDLLVQANFAVTIESSIAITHVLTRRSSSSDAPPPGHAGDRGLR